jgi:Ser/Thr protein kinase RdoA (MazF antagonist)
MLGRALARMHSIGAVRPFSSRPRLSIGRLGISAREAVLASDLVPLGLETRYADAAGQLLERIQRVFNSAGPIREIRIHGDCHLGNLLWNERGPVFVDLDDCMTGPKIQDLWMLLSGTPDEQQRQWGEIIEGYQQFADVDYRELRLVEPLRGLRMLHHAAWVAQRWNDPAFPRAFPWIGEAKFWENYVIDLLEQARAVDEPPIFH